METDFFKPETAEMTMRKGNLKTRFVELGVELVIASLLVGGMSAALWADTPTTRDDGVTVIHLDEHNG